MDDICLNKEELLRDIEVAVLKNFDSSDIKNIHEELKGNDSSSSIVDDLSTLFVKTLGKHKPKQKVNSKVKKVDIQQKSLAAHLEWKFVIRKNFDTFKERLGFGNRPENEQNNLLLLLSCYSEEILFHWSKNRKKLAESNETLTSNNELTNEMYERSLMTIGGGCIGEIWKLNKKRTIFGKKMKLTDQQRKTSQILWDCSLKIRRTSDEKAEIEFSGIGMRDSGGYFIPKQSLNPYLIKLNQLCRDILCPEGIKSHGHKILQVVFDRVKNHQEELESCFLACTKEIIPADNAKLFLAEFQRKFLHALSNEFITAKDASEVERKKQSSKGCSGLRDELYVLSKGGRFQKGSTIENGKGKLKAKTENRKPISNAENPSSSRTHTSLDETPIKSRFCAPKRLKMGTKTSPNKKARVQKNSKMNIKVPKSRSKVANLINKSNNSPETSNKNSKDCNSSRQNSKDCNSSKQNSKDSDPLNVCAQVCDNSCLNGQVCDNSSLNENVQFNCDRLAKVPTFSNKNSQVSSSTTKDTPPDCSTQKSLKVPYKVDESSRAKRQKKLPSRYLNYYMQ